MFDELLEIINMDPESRAKRDMKDYSTTDIKGGGIERNFLERGLDTLLGQQDSVQEAARTNYVDSLKNTQSGKYIRSNRPDLVETNITATTDQLDLDTAAVNEQGRKTAANDYISTGGGSLSRSELQSMTQEQIEALIPEARREGVIRDDDANPQTQREIAAQQELSGLRKDQELRAQRAQDFQEFTTTENRRERQFNEKMRRMDLEESRKDRKAELVMNREMKMLDRQYMRERDERADARADKRQRQQSIMTLVKGLTQLGAGFSI